MRWSDTSCYSYCAAVQASCCLHYAQAADIEHIEVDCSSTSEGLAEDVESVGLPESDPEPETKRPRVDAEVLTQGGRQVPNCND